MADNSIGNPFRQGDNVLIPENTLIRSTHPQQKERRSGRNQTVKVTMSHDGWVETDSYHGDLGKVMLPVITWAGSGGYWCDVQVTPELAAVNDVPTPELPGRDGIIYQTNLDVIPSYDDGYTNRWDF
jgi:hypothetical protein